jgi:hypothetical protein
MYKYLATKSVEKIHCPQCTAGAQVLVRFGEKSALLRTKATKTSELNAGNSLLFGYLPETP